MSVKGQLKLCMTKTDFYDLMDCKNVWSVVGIYLSNRMFYEMRRVLPSIVFRRFVTLDWVYNQYVTARPLMEAIFESVQQLDGCYHICRCGEMTFFYEIKDYDARIRTGFYTCIDRDTDEPLKKVIFLLCEVCCVACKWGYYEDESHYLNKDKRHSPELPSITHSLRTLCYQ